MYATPHLNSYTKENSIRIINKTNQPLTNIRLIFEDFNINISEYKIVRERGSLSYTPPLNFIELGNLFPNESAELYFKIDPSDTDLPLPPIPLDSIQICYSLEDDESIHSNLNTFLANNK
ncbi:MAG: hypothetical protein RSD26_02330 [Cellulosilyticaceae bacterium]